MYIITCDTSHCYCPTEDLWSWVPISVEHSTFRHVWDINKQLDTKPGDRLRFTEGKWKCQFLKVLMPTKKVSRLLFHFLQESELALGNNWPGLSSSFSSLLLCKNLLSSRQSMRSWAWSLDLASPCPQSVTISALSVDCEVRSRKRIKKNNWAIFWATGTTRMWRERRKVTRERWDD